MRLEKLCVYRDGEWHDAVRIHALPSGGYVVHHVEEDL